MSNLNVTVLMGRLVRAPIIRNNGSKMGFFYIASNRRYRDKAEVAQEETAFVACKCERRPGRDANRAVDNGSRSLELAVV